MDEAAWLACADLWRMREMMRRFGQDLGTRRSRLLLTACCRQIWHIMTDVRCRHAVETAERFADGQATQEELSTAQSAVRCRNKHMSNRYTAGYLAWKVAGLYPDSSHGCSISRWLAVKHAGGDPKDVASMAAAEGRQAVLLRDLAGNLFRPVALDPAWQVPAVLALAQAAYENRQLPAGTLDPDHLAVLADALEESGCDNADILNHCRQPGEHVRGCWVLDLLLDKDAR